MNPNKKPKPQNKCKKAQVWAYAGWWVAICDNCDAGGVYRTHAKAVHAAHQHMTQHATARPVTQLRQTRKNSWRNK